MSATPDELAAEAARWLRFAAEDLEESSADLARLSLWLVESRYPGEWPVTRRPMRQRRSPTPGTCLRR